MYACMSSNIYIRSSAAILPSCCTALPHMREHTPLLPFPPADPKGKTPPVGKVATASKVLKNKRNKEMLDGDDDLEEDDDGEDNGEDDLDEGEYSDDPFTSKKGYQLVRKDSAAAKQSATARKMAQKKRNATKEKASEAVNTSQDETDEAIRETFRRVKEEYDKLPPRDDDEYSNDQESGRKRKRKGKHKTSNAHVQLSAKLSAYARLATHDVSHIMYIYHFKFA